LNASPERSRQVANQLAEVDATLGREVDRQLVPVELPLGLGDLHLEAEFLNPLAGDPPDPVFVRAEHLEALEVLGARLAQHALPRDRCCATARAAGALAFRNRAGRRDPSPVFAAVGLDHDVAVQPDRLIVREEIASAVAFETDFNGLGHGRPSFSSISGGAARTAVTRRITPRPAPRAILPCDCISRGAARSARPAVCRT